MSRLWGWWRRPNGKPTVASRKRSLAALGDRLHEVNRERNEFGRQVQILRAAVAHRNAQIAALERAGTDLGDQLQQAESQLDRVRQIVANPDRGLSYGQIVQQVRAELGEGERRG